MNLLINCPFKFNINNESKLKIGGIESLNIDLAREFINNEFNVTLSSISNKKIINKNNLKNISINQITKNSDKFSFDYIISSNDSTIFDYFPKAKKFLWLHNPLQIEKAIRKKQFIPIIKHKPTVIFVSEYLNKITSSLFFFKKRIVINNFLLSDFKIKKKDNNIRKPLFIWAVARSRGLNETIKMWIQNIHPSSKKAKFLIFGNDKFKFEFSKNFLKSKNIYFMGRVERKLLKKIYEKSTAMICLGHDETFCLNALEANSCGLPIISFGRTALSKFIIDGFNGFKINNFTELSQKIKFFLNKDDNFKKKIINNCFNHSKKFLLKNIFFHWNKLLK